MAYRTKTYIAGDWDGDKSVIDKLYSWKNDNRLNLDFHDAHEMAQSRDTSLPCSIKASLKKRLDASKTFVLIVGNHTKNLTKGGCEFCTSYNGYGHYCARGYCASGESFVDYECRMALEARMKIIVIYNSTVVNRSLCPNQLKSVGTHIPFYYDIGLTRYYNYNAVKTAVMNDDYW